MSGMSVKAVTMAGEKWYIGGAPRSKNVGQVMMFKHGARGSGYLDLNPAHVLTGQVFGSGFGYDIAVADFNLDKLVNARCVLCGGNLGLLRFH